MLDLLETSWQPRQNGKFAHRVACDACGKAVNMDGDWESDNEIANGSDGPGFYLCVRPACIKKRQKLGVVERTKLYTMQRMKNDEAATARGKVSYGKAYEPPKEASPEAAAWTIGTEVRSGNGMKGVVTGHDSQWVLVSWEKRPPKKVAMHNLKRVDNSSDT